MIISVDFMYFFASLFYRGPKNTIQSPIEWQDLYVNTCSQNTVAVSQAWPQWEERLAIILLTW